MPICTVSPAAAASMHACNVAMHGPLGVRLGQVNVVAACAPCDRTTPATPSARTSASVARADFEAESDMTDSDGLGCSPCVTAFVAIDDARSAPAHSKMVRVQAGADVRAAVLRFAKRGWHRQTQALHAMRSAPHRYRRRNAPCRPVLRARGGANCGAAAARPPRSYSDASPVAWPGAGRNRGPRVRP